MEILVLARSLGNDGTNNYFNYPPVDRPRWCVITVVFTAALNRIVSQLINVWK
jgi:hypothetical protein